MRCWARALLLSGGLGWSLMVSPPEAAAQSVSGIQRSMLDEVVPGATRFEPRTGEPPVIRAYDGDRLVGFVFRTVDVPPEPMGYSGPVQAVVGLGLDGRVTGVRVTEYRESYRSSMGDFLRRPGVQEQFAGKSIQDAFQVNGDVERVTRATISTRALARSVRDGSRRVAEAYAQEMEVGEVAGPIVLEELTWYEMQTRGVLKRILIDSPEGHLDISLTHLPDDSVAAFFMGEDNVERVYAQEERVDRVDATWIFYALEGPRLRFFVRNGWFFEQGGDTLPLAQDQVYSLGLVREGRVEDEAVLHGVFLLDDRLEPTRPFTLLYRLEGHEGYYSAAFDALEEPPPVVAEVPAPVADEERAEVPSEDPVEVAAVEEGAPPPEEPEPDTAANTAPDSAPTSDSAMTSDSAAASAPATPSDPGEFLPPGPLEQEESSELARTLASTDWSRVAGLLVVILLALTAFFLKRPMVRGVSLAATLVYLGFMDGGFLSVSHLTAAIWTGPSIFVRDVSLFLLASVTLVTTLVWGRVFCGFLCPFGALQDLMDRVVPEGWKLSVPDRVHRPALGVKYLVLAGVLVPAFLGSGVSLYQYVEPFGTVFFPSRSLLLWSIAGIFLLGAVFIPRFYCRYACPLGAALALVSFVSPRRIGRVQQCQLCKVCEQDCPTGAIRGPEIDFVECVRCNRCETNLIRRKGSCRHDMSDIRSRLVQIQGTSSAGTVARHEGGAP